jgi:arylformamidase
MPPSHVWPKTPCGAWMKARSSRDWIDITMEFGAKAGTFPGDTPFRMEWTGRIGGGQWAVNLSQFSSSPHNGTHSDAPIHVLPRGKASESLDPSAYVGPCIVVDATRIRKASLPASLIDGIRAPRIVFKTRARSAGNAFPRSFPGLSLELADRLARRGTRLVGTDAPSMDAADSKGLPAHKALFAGGVHLLENLELSSVKPGRYELVALPLKVRGLCAAPVRALLKSKA